MRRSGDDSGPEETKSAFKSKALGELRQRLELLLEHN
jgi:hypothetical protein